MQRLPALLRAPARLCRTQVTREYGHGEHKTFKELGMINKNTMDHLPKPSGSWQHGYSAKDRKANIALGGTITALLLTLAEMERQGCFDLLGNPAYWSEKQVARQARYYAKGNPWRKAVEEEDDDDE